MRTVLVISLFLIAIALGAGCSQQDTSAAPDTAALAVSTPANQQAGPEPSVAATVVAPLTTPTAVPYSGRFIDTHVHIRPSSMSYADIIRLMDENKIDRMIVMEPPGDQWISGTPSSVYGVPDAAVQYPDRFSVMYSGEAGSMLYEAAKTGKYTPEQEREYTVQLEQAMASGKYRGFGEIGLRHQPPPGMPATYDITVPADHPWMFIMSDIAAKYKVPLDLHLQAGDTDVAAFERLLDHNKDTTIIWDHAGDHTQNLNPDTLRPLLASHENLYTSIKIRTREKQEQGGIMTRDGTISEKWKALITNYPDRFIVGTDVKLGIRSEDLQSVSPHNALLSQLPFDVAIKVAQDNPKRIFGLS